MTVSEQQATSVSSNVRSRKRYKPTPLALEGTRPYKKPLKLKIRTKKEILEAKPLTESEKSMAAEEFLAFMAAFFFSIELKRHRAVSELTKINRPRLRRHGN